MGNCLGSASPASTHLEKDQNKFVYSQRVSYPRVGKLNENCTE